MFNLSLVRWPDVYQMPILRKPIVSRNHKKVMHDGDARTAACRKSIMSKSWQLIDRNRNACVGN